MHFTQVEIKCNPDFIEILIAELSEANYDSFWEKDDGFIAYIEDQQFEEKGLRELNVKYPEANISYSFAGLESKNWNEEWEKNFQPIIIANKCYVRSTFHDKKPEIPLEIVIEPKMSFGTGHHATTSMMLEHLLEIDLTGKRLMDVGCGTAILSIAASKLGANPIFAFDIDDWAVDNSVENLQINHIRNIIILKGTIADFQISSKFDVVLANITKNVILEETEKYFRVLEPDGLLILSGFYEADLKDIEDKLKQYGFLKRNLKVKDNWASCSFILNT